MITNVWSSLYGEILMKKETFVQNAHAQLNGTAHLIDPRTIDFSYNLHEQTLEICTLRKGTLKPIISYIHEFTNEEKVIAEYIAQDIREYQTSRLEFI